MPSATVSASLRARAGLTQEELGLLLGVSKGQVSHVEAGRRGYSARAQARPARLSELLPARLFRPGGALAAPAVPLPAPAGEGPGAGPTPEEQAALRRRLRACRHTLAGLAYAAGHGSPLAAALARRTRALAALRAALAAETAPAPGTAPARDLAWVELVELATARLARRQPSPTAQAWAALRRQLLETEAAGRVGAKRGPPA